MAFTKEANFFWLALQSTPGLGNLSCLRLVESFGNPAQIFDADKEQLVACGVTKNVVKAIAEKTGLEKAEQEMLRAEQEGVSIISWSDSLYPDLLRNIHNPPVVLYVKGKKESLNHNSLAVIGARAATSYGRETAGRLASQLSAAGLAIVSGLALGIDTAAHNGALAVNGATLAVLGCGVNVVYPRQNRKLYDAITSRGAIISEYPFDTPPDAFRFPARNRIISGLTYGVLVVEAAKRSGSLITAELALEQGREVFAVPGRIDSYKSTGTHKLLQQGAKLVLTVEDVLQELPFQAHNEFVPSKQKEAENAFFDEEWTPEEKKIMNSLDVYPKDIDVIIRETGLPPQAVSELLLILELNGLVAAAEGNRFKLKRSRN